MQTFLPFPSFINSAETLDDKRLGKQRVEAKQIFLALTQPGYGWQHHPAVRMWRGHQVALAHYGRTMCDEWISRGFKDSLRSWFDDQIRIGAGMDWLPHNPAWLGNIYFHRSHQSNLVRKNPEHYRKYFPDVPADLPYVWPKGIL